MNTYITITPLGIAGISIPDDNHARGKHKSIRLEAPERITYVITCTRSEQSTFESIEKIRIEKFKSVWNVWIH